MLSYTAFQKYTQIAHGELREVALIARKKQKQHPDEAVLIFSDATGKQMDLDLNGTEKQILERLKIYQPKLNSFPPPKAGAGRPRLGVVTREVSLLPAHWEWLSNQPGGASGILRMLIYEKLQRASTQAETIKQKQETVYRFLSGLAGDLPQFEEAIRYLYRRDKALFASILRDWPGDIAKHTWSLSKKIF